MTVELSIHLFGKPAWELDDFEGDLPTDYSKKLRELGGELEKRLHDTAYVFDVLVKNGWQPCGTMKEAEQELKTLGLQDYIENLIELEEEKEWEEEEKQ